MKPIPQTENPLIIRTDFSDQAAREKICAIVRMPVGIFGFRAHVEFLDDVAYADLTKSQLLELLPSDYDHTFLIVADKTAISLPGHPLLIIDLYEGTGNEFRALPSRIQGIENNLSIANMNFEEFSGSVDEDGIFRGFPKS